MATLKDQFSLPSSDVAALVRDVGGIDLDKGLLNMRINRDEEGMPLSLSMPDSAMINVAGLTPRIIEISSARNLPIFLDLLNL